MLNFFRKNEQTTSFEDQQPETLELDEQELEQTTGGCGDHHYHRHHHHHYCYRHNCYDYCDDYDYCD